MIQAKIQPTEVAAEMYQHTMAIIQMKTVSLDLDWLKEFPASQITDCCSRLAASFSLHNRFLDNCQRELIQNEEFAVWLSQLVDQAQSESAAEDDDGASADYLRKSGLEIELSKLLEACWAHECEITAFTPAEVLRVIKLADLTALASLIYLNSFAPTDPSSERGKQIVRNLSVCTDVPLILDDAQKALLAEPFPFTRPLFFNESFAKISELFSYYPELTEIPRLLCRYGVYEHLDLENYSYFAEDAMEYHRLLSTVIQTVGQKAGNAFMHYWERDKCTLTELKRMVNRITSQADRDWDSVLSTYVGYINLLYGTRFKAIDLSTVAGYQEEVLTYAIVNNKKHFIRLVDENAERFLEIPRSSILFSENIYQEHFNLNELTAKDLADCAWMTAENLSGQLFKDTRQYTFPELKLLYKASWAYVELFCRLRSDNRDYRIKVLQQLLKRDVLYNITIEQSMIILAGLLDQKPLHNWRQEEFGHIDGLSATDTVQLMLHLDKLTHLLPSIETRTDAMLALRCTEHLEQFDSMDALKENLLDTDRDWLMLADDMKLTPEFKARYRNTILRFLCEDGAGIATTYLDSLEEKKHPAFHRVVKAELMGQFSALKYFEGDLAHELGCSVPEAVKTGWPNNLATEKNGIEVREQDDFFSTMLLGSQPRATCLNYQGGAYCSCLLACFDSNKKTLYAKKAGRIVGRACIRLTKCRFSATGKKGSDANSSFSFVDLEDVAGSREQERHDEHAALFLERPYIDGVSPEDKKNIMSLFVGLVRQKAQEIGTMLVLSSEYAGIERGFAQTYLYIYISASKAGAQYLDSLGGQATVSDQGSYEGNRFFVDQSLLPQKKLSINEE